jgi:hypothetical protein
MSTQRFDELTKQVAKATSRRQVFKLLAGGAAVVAGTLLGSRAAEAAEPHLCCVFACTKDGENFKSVHQCVRPDPTHGCTAPPNAGHCVLLSTSVTTKCSDCGEVGGGVD